MIDYVDGRRFGDIRILFPVTPGGVGRRVPEPAFSRPGPASSGRIGRPENCPPEPPPPRMVAPMSTNISENRHHAFEPLTGGEASNFCLFARYVELELRIGHTLWPSRVPLPQPTGMALSN